jgi:hypothetical protein
MPPLLPRTLTSRGDACPGMSTLPGCPVLTPESQGKFVQLYPVLIKDKTRSCIDFNVMSIQILMTADHGTRASAESLVKQW